MKENSQSETDKTIPTLPEESSTLGDIRINNSVIKNIVRLASLEVDGVYSVGGGFVDGLAEMFGTKDARGVEVTEDEGGNYLIEVAVIVRFGCEIAHTAVEVQQSVKRQVQRMTLKNVGKVNVTVEGIRMEEPESAKKDKKSWDENISLQ